MDATGIIRMLYKRRISEPVKLLLASQEGTLNSPRADVLLTVAPKVCHTKLVQNREAVPHAVQNNTSYCFVVFFYSIYFDHECVTRIDNFIVGFGLSLAFLCLMSGNSV